MINNCVAFDHKIPNKNLMSIVNMNYMYVYGSYCNPSQFFFISDGDKGDGEGNSGGGRATVTMVEGKRRWRGRQEQRWRRQRGWRVAKRIRVSKWETNHFILNWNKMIEAKGDG